MRRRASQVAARVTEIVHVLAQREVEGLASLPKVTLHVLDFDALPSLPAVDDVSPGVSFLDNRALHRTPDHA